MEYGKSEPRSLLHDLGAQSCYLGDYLYEFASHVFTVKGWLRL